MAVAYLIWVSNLEQLRELLFAVALTGRCRRRSATLVASITLVFAVRVLASQLRAGGRAAAGGAAQAGHVRAGARHTAFVFLLLLVALEQLREEAPAATAAAAAAAAFFLFWMVSLHRCCSRPVAIESVT